MMLVEIEAQAEATLSESFKNILRLGMTESAMKRCI